MVRKTKVKFGYYNTSAFALLISFALSACNLTKEEQVSFSGTSTIESASKTTEVIINPTPTIDLDAPSNLMATVTSNTQINLSWMDNSLDEVGFRIERSTNANFTNPVIVATTAANAVSYSVTGLSSSTTYYFRVIAVGVSAESTASPVKSAMTQAAPITVPAAPSSLAAVSASSTQINLTWVDNANNESSFEVDRANDAAFATGLITSTVNTSNATTYSATGLNPSTTYYFRVRSKNTAGNSTNSNTANAMTQAPPVTVPASPSGLAANAVSQSQVNLTWVDNSNNESGFKVQYATNSSFTSATTLPTTAQNVVSLSVTGLAASTTYYFRISATNSAGDSSFSVSATASTPAAPTAPSAPSNLTGTAASTTAINLTWVDTSSNESGFVLERSTASNFTSPVLLNLNANVTTASVTGLTASTTYYFRVKATNTVGSSAYSATATVATQANPTAPSAPSSLAGIAASSSSINLTWVDSSSNETGFVLERATTSAFTGAVTSNLNANVTSASVSSLNASTTYYFRIKATNAVGSSAYSNVINVATQAPPVTVPAAPSGLIATATSQSQINLTWTDNSNNETGFKVQYSTNSAFTSPTTLPTTASNAVSLSVTGLNASTTYYFRLSATNSAGDSGFSPASNATTQAAPTAPAAPSNLAGTAPTSTSINLTWTDNSNNESGFILERATTSSFTTITTTNYAANITSASISGLTASTTYYFRLKATNAVGNSANSGTATVSTPAPPVTIPTAPSGLAATASAYNQINLTWTDNSNNESGFKVQYSTSSAFTSPVTLPTTAQNTTSASITSLSGSTTYYFRVLATNSAGDSAYSSTANATTPAMPTAPSAPTTLAGTAASSTSINLTWVDTSNNETGFSLEHSQSSTFASGVTTTTLAANLTSKSISSLSASTTYYFRIRATNAVGNSSYSNTATVATLPTVPSAPTNLVALAISGTQINLTWTDNSNNETGFKVQYATNSSFTSATTMATTAANATAVSVSGLSSGTTYYFRVAATNAAGDSAYSASVSRATQQVPSTPTASAPTGITTTAATFTWTPGTSTSQTSFATTLYPVLTNRCSSCHSSDNQNGTSAHSSTDVGKAHTAMFFIDSSNRKKIDLAAPTSSRIYTKLTEGHQCGTTCAPEVLNAINSWITGGAGTGGITTSYDFKYSTSASLANATTVTNVNYPYSINTLAAGTTYYFQVVAKNSIGSTNSSILNFATQSSGGGGTTPPINFQTELRVADRRYVMDVFNSVFGTSLVLPNSSEPSNTLRSYIWEQAAFGGACDVYAGVWTGGFAFENYNERCPDGIDSVTLTNVNPIRMAYMSKACDLMVSNTTTLNTAFTKIFGSTTAGAVNDANLLKAYQLFYPEDTLPTNVRDALIALGNSGSAATDTDRWKNIILGVCGTTEWWIKY